ncbi:MAG: 2-phosphosulfolactate phosphatase [Planctomyces sp.]|nr:2-phosphosulfolactate phosphatase [Planctomyces sp.]
MRVHVALHFHQLTPEMLAGSVAVVIDVLRASTTIVHALAAGAEAVIPCQEVEEARNLKRERPDEKFLLGGERQGLRIPGFDFDNSPFAYAADVVRGRAIAFTTTNGTRALAAAAGAARVLVGAFVNRAAIVRELRRAGRPVCLVCAGTDGGITAEDVLFAGTAAMDLVGDVQDSGPASAAVSIGELEASKPEDVEDPLGTAVAFARAHGSTLAERLATLRASRGGRNLIEIGQASDIERAAEDSLFATIPEWDRGANRFVAADAERSD